MFSPLLENFVSRWFSRRWRQGPRGLTVVVRGGDRALLGVPTTDLAGSGLAPPVTGVNKMVNHVLDVGALLGFRPPCGDKLCGVDQIANLEAGVREAEGIGVPPATDANWAVEATVGDDGVGL